MESSNSVGSSYKDKPFPVQHSSPPSLPSSSSSPPSSASELATITNNTLTITATTTDGELPSAHRSPFSNRPQPLVTPSRTRSSLITPPPWSSRSTAFSPRAVIAGTPARLEQYDWRPILLTPPPTAKRSESTSSYRTPVKEGRDTPALCKHTFHYRAHCNDAWPESPTLSIKRKFKHSLPGLGLEQVSLRVAAKRAKREQGFPKMASSSSLPLLPSSIPSKDSESARLTAESSRANLDSHSMLPPFKPRALTLDGIDRPTLPPMLGYPPTLHGNGRAHSKSLIGPFRTSPTRTFSPFRHGNEHRSDPYFVSTPQRRSVDHARSTPSLSPTSTREASYFDTWTPLHNTTSSSSSSSSSTPWTPTSSLRSTFSSVHQQDAFASSFMLGRTSLSSPSSHLGGHSLNGPHSKRSEPIDLPAVAGVHPYQQSHFQQQQHAIVTDNALALYMEPAPFPPELLHLNLGREAHHHQSSHLRGGGRRSWTPRSEADSYFRPNASSLDPFINARSSSAFTRSPASLSDPSPQTPSPLSFEEGTLPKLSLGHRYGLDTANMALPGLLRPITTVPSQPLPKHVMPQQMDNDFLYKMPVLRAMSPLANMSSDSEEEEQEEELDHSMTASSCLTTLSGSQDSAASGSKTESKRTDLPEEGCTGEIFRTMRTQLPITTKQGVGKGTKQEQLFCKLDSTTHQCFSVVDGKWACYRRNYLKVDVAFHLVDASGQRRDNVSGDLILQTSPNSRHPTPFVIDHFAVHLSAHVLDSTSGKLQRGRQGTVPLIQFGPARERGPRDPVQPATLRPGGNITKDATGNEQTSARTGNIAAFRRVQIRSATMNNGQRGSAGQQFYALKLTLLAYARDSSDGVEVASVVSEPITVRGRSKVHYAPLNGAADEEAGTGGARKEEKRKEVTAPTGSRSRARSVSTVPSIRNSTSSTRSNSTSSRKQSTRASNKRRSGYEQHRRSTRLLLAANNSGATTMEDADDESEADTGDAASSSPNATDSRSKVMDIQNVL